MRKIITTTFVTLDGVLQAPGGPEEDSTINFAWGGWIFNYWDELMGNVLNGFMKQPFDLLFRHCSQTNWSIPFTFGFFR